jgi:hypothetical protein
MLELEGSEPFVDVHGLAGHKFNQLHTFTTQAWITTLKGNANTTSHQMALLRKDKNVCCRVSEWKAMEPISMRNLFLFLVVNNVF